MNMDFVLVLGGIGALVLAVLFGRGGRYYYYRR